MARFSFKLFKRLPADEFRITIPTILTLSRIILTPCIVASILYGKWNYAFWMFVFSGITDLLDGWIARTFNQQTFLGSCLDPVADKLMIIACFATLACTDDLPFIIPRWFVLLVLIKEAILIGGACYLYYKQGYLRIAPTWLGKGTMFVQTMFITWLFACYFFKWVPFKTYHAMLGLMIFMICASLVQYTRIGLAQSKG